jgi:AcrR family transcriptional regulator
MSSPSASSHQGRAYSREEVEQLLRDSLIELMSDGTPFRALSVDRLHRTAGISRSSFYVYFSDKADMLQALEAGALHRLYGSQRRWIGKGVECTREDVRLGMRDLIDRYLEDEVIMRAVGEASGYEPAIREAYVKGVYGYARAIERLIKELQAAGRRTHLHPGDTSRALAWMTERTVFLDVQGASARRLDTIAASLADIISTALLEDH